MPVADRPARERAWTAAARFDAVLTTAAMDEAGKSAWCRANGVHPQELAAWQQAATQALAEPEEARASPQQTKQDQRRIKELERELRRKEKALAETAALLVLSKKSRLSSTRTRARTNDRPRRSPSLGPRHSHGCAKPARWPASMMWYHSTLESPARPRCGRWPAHGGASGPGACLESGRAR